MLVVLPNRQRASPRVPLGAMLDREAEPTRSPEVVGRPTADAEYEMVLEPLDGEILILIRLIQSASAAIGI